MTELIHLPCTTACRCLGGPEPPDPDRYGNMRVPYECPECDERVTVTFTRHGGSLAPKGFAFADQIDWRIELHESL